jgi:mRNA-degrading endonuclease RelE of RelBE toxin-antitoxin system
MTYSVLFSKKAAKLMRKLPRDLFEHAKSSFADLSQEPFRYLEHFEGDEAYKFRVGSYRALIDVDFAQKILWVRVFDKRGRIYKRLHSKYVKIGIRKT